MHGKQRFFLQFSQKLIIGAQIFGMQREHPSFNELLLKDFRIFHSGVIRPFAYTAGLIQHYQHIVGQKIQNGGIFTIKIREQLVIRRGGARIQRVYNGLKDILSFLRALGIISAGFFFISGKLGAQQGPGFFQISRAELACGSYNGAVQALDRALGSGVYQAHRIYFIIKKFNSQRVIPACGEHVRYSAPDGNFAGLNHRFGVLIAHFQTAGAQGGRRYTA